MADDTSMATPHVAGAAALYLSANPSATPAQVTNAILGAATPNVIINPGSGSPNRLVFTGPNTPPPPPMLFRYFNGSDHISALSNPGGSYHQEGAFGRVLTTQVAGSKPIFQCRTKSDYFTSLTANCEGKVVIGLIGYIYSSAPPGAIAMYRCVVRGSGDHFDSPAANCEGQNSEGILGYLV